MTTTTDPTLEELRIQLADMNMSIATTIIFRVLMAEAFALFAYAFFLLSGRVDHFYTPWVLIGSVFAVLISLFHVYKIARFYVDATRFKKDGAL